MSARITPPEGTGHPDEAQTTPATTPTEAPMNLNDGARVRHPRDPVEYRLGTVTDIVYAPYSTYIKRLRLRFPTGEERNYPASQVRACSRTDDHAALVTALTDTSRSLRDACRIAHDYDQRLSADIVGLLLAVQGIAASRLGITLDPASLDQPPATGACPAPGANRADEPRRRS